MALVDTAIRGLKPQQKPKKYSDGGGLHLLVNPNGSKLWRLAYRFDGKQKTLAFGAYPKVTLADARALRERAKKALADGIDPAKHTNIDKTDHDTFEAIGREWLESQEPTWAPKYAPQVFRQFERDVFPALGDRPVDAIEASEVLKVLRAVEARGAQDIAKRLRQKISAIFRYAIATDRAKHDPAANLKGALKPPPKTRHMAALKAAEMPEFLERLRAFDGDPKTALALELVIHTMTRTAEVRFARWAEIEGDLWRIPAERMKAGRDHIIPLSRQAKAILERLKELAGKVDLSLIGIGIGPIVPSANVATWGVDEVTHSGPDDEDDDLLAMALGAPMQLDEGQLEGILADLPENWVEDRDNWLTVGAALHHQFEGNKEGFDIWCEWSRQSGKFDQKDSARVWKSFKGSKKPVRVATLIQAASAHRMILEMDFEDNYDGFALDLPPSAQLPAVMSSNSLDDLLDLTTKPQPVTAVNNVETDPDWHHLLHRNEEGELKSTLHNSTLILRNDRRTAGIVCYNNFSQSLVLKHKPGRVKKKREMGKAVINLDGAIWNLEDPANGDPWTKVHDATIRRMIEAPTTQGGYGIKITDRDLNGAIDMCASENAFHPVRERLLAYARQWDGKRRIGTFFIDYLGCEDIDYHRQAAVTMLLGAVARVFEPGHKFDFVAILEGAQGAGKSTFIKILALEWFSELATDVSDNNKMVEAMQGSWIIEIGELSSMSRADVNDLKAFVSRQVDKARLAYEPRVMLYPRQCIFIGSTNDREYLRDTTGNRRYWPIVCNLGGRMIDNVRLREEVHQIWAEAVLLYQEMRKKTPIGDLPLYLSNKDAAAQAKLIQDAKLVETAEDVMAAKILAWLNIPVVEGDGFSDPNGDRPVHEATCIAHVWEDFLGMKGSIPHNEAMKIGKALQMIGWPRSQNRIHHPKLFKKFGYTRVYTRHPGNRV